METIKEEKKADLEQLLNSLIEKGWKPFGSNYERYEHGCLIHEFTTKDGVYSYGQYPTTLREFCAKESGLWQFVCENGMVKKEGNSEWTIIYPNERTGDYQKCHSYCKGQSEYWILESSLKDESELEDFLLSNIVIKDE